MATKDLFSGHADQYAQFRPGYPEALFGWLVQQSPNRRLLLDVGTGNGQVPMGLSPHFEQVVATDISAQQLANAPALPNVQYVVAAAERSPLPDHSADLITVAQALHWFDFEVFGAELQRVARPGAFFAAWTYGLCQTSPDCDAMIQHFYTEVVGPYWDARRKWVDAGYQGIPLPIEEIQAPAFHIEYQWSVARLCAYLRTWSSVQAYLRQHETDPVTALEQRLGLHWPADELRPVRFPIALRAGKVVQ